MDSTETSFALDHATVTVDAVIPDCISSRDVSGVSLTDDEWLDVEDAYTNLVLEYVPRVLSGEMPAYQTFWDVDRVYVDTTWGDPFCRAVSNATSLPKEQAWYIVDEMYKSSNPPLAMWVSELDA